MRRTACNGLRPLQIPPCAHKEASPSFQLCVDASPYDFKLSTCCMVDIRFRQFFDRSHSSADQCTRTPKQQSTAVAAGLGRDRWSVGVFSPKVTVRDG